MRMTGNCPVMTDQTVLAAFDAAANHPTVEWSVFRTSKEPSWEVKVLKQ